MDVENSGPRRSSRVRTQTEKGQVRAAAMAAAAAKKDARLAQKAQSAQTDAEFDELAAMMAQMGMGRRRRKTAGRRRGSKKVGARRSQKKMPKNR